MLLNLEDRIKPKDRLSIPLRYKVSRFIEKTKLKFHSFNEKSIFIFDGVMCLFEGEDFLRLLSEKEVANANRKTENREKVGYWRKRCRSRLWSFQVQNSL